MDSTNKDSPGSQVVSFSDKTISKQVLNMSLFHPVSVFPGSLGLVSCATAFAIKIPFFLMLGITGIGISFSAFIINVLLRRDSLAKIYINEMRKFLQIKNEREFAELQDSLEELDCEIASKQLQEGKEKIDNYLDLLKDLFIPTELTFMKYSSVAEQIFIGIQDSLSKVVRLKKAIIDTEGEMVDEQNKIIDEILQKNEDALNALDKCKIALSRIDTKQGRATMKILNATEEMRYLADIASIYNIK